MATDDSTTPTKRERQKTAHDRRAPELIATLAPHERFVDELGASIITAMSTHWLNRARVEGIGPAWRKVTNRVRYRVSDLLEWLDSDRCATEHLAAPKPARRKPVKP
ncbi:hypothetical protein BH11MYX3_BH11MYX3_04630 [soil metagenome]